MSISLVRLAVTGPEKPVAAVDFTHGANLVLGPSDTGKSYIVGCIKYALGSDTKPKQIPFASGYDRLALQFLAGGTKEYTIFKSLAGGKSHFYEGYYDTPPLNKDALKTNDVNEFIVKLLGLDGKKILQSQEKKGKLTAGDLRHFAIYTEGDTLSEHSYLGTNVTTQPRRRSALYLMLTGVDDSAVVLGANNDERLTTQGQLLAIDESIKSYHSELPEDFDADETKNAIVRIDIQMKANQDLLRENSAELNELRSKLSVIGQELVKLDYLRVSAIESLERFSLLDEKYCNDLERLQLIRSAASVFDEFTPQSCALCNTPVMIQSKMVERKLPSAEEMSMAADAEYKKIEGLRLGLNAAISNVKSELLIVDDSRQVALSQQKQLASRQVEIVTQHKTPQSSDLVALTDRRSEYVSQLKTHERIQDLTAKRNKIEPRSKKTKIDITRNASDELSALVTRVQALLNSWGLEEARQVAFDESLCDLRIMERPRLSYGKGKRAIFLAAYSIALMERAVTAEAAHLGFVVIDSPVLTYRDPKCLSSEEAISDTVANRFFEWMATWDGPGQLIVLENEEPKQETLDRIPRNVFVGPNVSGRRGFYP